MPLYNFNKIKDKYTLEAEEALTIELSYNDKTIEKVDLLSGDIHVLCVSLDGEYTLKISNTIEDEEVVFYSKIKLQNSIVNSTYKILCNSCKGCGKEFITNSCLSKKCKEFLEIQNIFNKLSVYQNIYVLNYSEDYFKVFNNYISTILNNSGCSLQDSINSIIMDECITGLSKHNLKLFKIIVYAYWYATYNLEKLLYKDNVEELEFLKEKFMTSTIDKCACNLCVNLSSKDVPPVQEQDLEIYSFQFDDFISDINNLEPITRDWLILNGVQHIEADMLVGKDIPFSTIGRIGFAIKSIVPNPYRIIDGLNNDVTDVAFDSIYNLERQITYYVSKEIMSAPSIPFKFIKT